MSSKEKNENASNMKLKSSIGLFEAATMVVGIVIGSGIFFKASSVFRNAGSPFWGIMAWIIGGIVTIASALTVTEIATAIPKTGGVFVYMKELYNDRLAFLYGWVQAVIYVPGVCAALSIVLVTQATFFIPMSNMTQKFLAIGIILFITIVNIISTKLGSKVQVVFTIGKLIPIILIIAFGMLKGTTHGVQSIASTAGGSVGIAGFGAAILGTLWAYDGWIAVSNMAGEMKNPAKDLPKAIILGLASIIVVYIAINIAIINTMSIQAVVDSSKAASDAAVVLLGSNGAGLIAAGIMISIFGALNGYTLTGVRIPFAMAQYNMLPFASVLGKIDERTGTPINALIVQMVLAILYVFSGTFDMLTNIVVFVMWSFFIMTVAGIFVLRKRFSHLPRKYSVPLYPIVPIIGIVGGVYILGSTLLMDTVNALVGIGITLLGLPVYAFVNKKKNPKVKMQSETV